MTQTSAFENIFISNNATWQDAFQFGKAGDTTWSFTGMSFKSEVKVLNTDTAPLLTAQSSDGSIVVDDVVQRVLHFNVPDTAIQAALPVGEYVYDLIMIDTSTPPIRTQLMQGKLVVRQGVTGD